MPTLTVPQIKKVAALIQERERLDVQIKAILGNESGSITKPPRAQSVEGMVGAKKAKAVGGLGSPARRLQGRYMGLTSKLPPELKAEAIRIRAEQGIEAAIKYVESLASEDITEPAATTETDEFAEAGV